VTMTRSPLERESARCSARLAMTGGVVAMVRLVLLVQNATDRFDIWAYAGPWCCWPGPARDGGWWA
jgi:hypothetical protein